MNPTRRAARPSRTPANAPTNAPINAPINAREPLALWINRGLEALWLLAAALVPLVYFNDSVSSLPDINFWSVAKITLLRSLAGLMLILWLAEGALRGWSALQLSQTRGQGNSSGHTTAVWLTPNRWFGGLAAWLRGQPGRWLILAAMLYLASVLLSTALSASFFVSLWGEVPGLDNYSAHNVLAYTAIFGALVTHLKTPAQLHRSWPPLLA